LIEEIQQQSASLQRQLLHSKVKVFEHVLDSRPPQEKRKTGKKD
jgi:hypothetical protein